MRRRPNTGIRQPARVGHPPGPLSGQSPRHCATQGSDVTPDDSERNCGHRGTHSSDKLQLEQTALEATMHIRTSPLHDKMAFPPDNNSNPQRSTGERNRQSPLDRFSSRLECESGCNLADSTARRATLVDATARLYQRICRGHQRRQRHKAGKNTRIARRARYPRPFRCIRGPVHVSHSQKRMTATNLNSFSFQKGEDLSRGMPGTFHRHVGLFMLACA